MMAVALMLRELKSCDRELHLFDTFAACPALDVDANFEGEQAPISSRR